MVTKKVVPSEEGSRAACHTPVKKVSQEEEDTTVDIRRRNDITVNGVSLIDIMRKKSVESKKKTPVRKVIKKKDKTTPSII